MVKNQQNLDLEGLDEAQIDKFTGVYFMIQVLQFEKIERTIVQSMTVGKSKNTLRLRYWAPGIFEYDVTLNAEQEIIIVNDFISDVSHSIIFIALMCGIVRESQTHFYKINFLARGSFTTVEKCGNYYLAAIAGFTPVGNSYADIALVAIEHGFYFTSVERLFHTTKGRAFWRMWGKSWCGEFMLASDYNVELLRKELSFRKCDEWL